MRRGAERGVALIVVLLVLVSATLILTTYSVREREGLDALMRAKTVDRLLLLGLSAEAWVLSVLEEDARSSYTDTLDEDWARPVNNLPIEGGMLSGKLVDLNRYININRFVASTPKSYEREQAKPNSDLALMKRVFYLADTELSDLALSSLVDWQDADETKTINGYETVDYQLFERPYRAANGALVDLSELKLIEGFDEQSIHRLEPLITVIPPESVSVNVNTAARDVLMALWEEIDDGVADDLVSLREASDWNSKEAFLTDLVRLTGVPEEGVKAALDREGFSPVAVESEFFNLFFELTLDDMRMVYSAVLRRARDDDGIRLRVESRSVNFVEL